MKSVSEQRERIIGLKSEMPKAKDVPDGTIYENLTDGTVNIAYHGTWYEKKNVDIDLSELESQIDKRLPFLNIKSSDRGDGHHNVDIDLNFTDSNKKYFGLIYVNSPEGELWAFTLSVGGYSLNQLTNSSHGVDFEVTRPEYNIYLFTNVGSTNPFELVFLNFIC